MLAKRARADTPQVTTGLIILLGSMTALGPLTIDFYLPALPEMADDLHTSEAPLQLTLTASLVGLALGQAVLGPMSDVVGRRRPLVIGLLCYAVASAACVVAPNVGVLIAARLVQAFAGAAGQVIARAIVRDVVAGRSVARVLSMLLLVTGAAPILAPMLGGQMLAFASWRGLFALLTVYGLVVAVIVFFRLPETLPPERRGSGGLVPAGRTYAVLLRDRIFVGYALVGGIGFGAMFAYLSGSSFVYQEVFGLSPQMYGLVFGLTAVALVGCSQLNVLLLRWFDPRSVLNVGQLVGLSGGALLLVAALVPSLGLTGIVVAFIIAVGTRGLVMPNATALCLNRHPEVAGSASALVGTVQFAVGALVGPLVTITEVRSAVPMAVVFTGALVAAYLVMVVVAWPPERAERAKAVATEVTSR